MPFQTYLIVAAVAYLLGSIPFGFLLVLAFRREDIRTKGSGNIGATNVVRSGAKGLGALTFLMDAVKGYAAVLLGAWLAGHSIPVQDGMALAAFMAIIGHLYPVWLGFKGGKGVATAFGVFLALAWLPAVSALGIFLLTFALSRYVSLASILAAVAFPIFALVFPHLPYNTWLTAVILILPLIVIAKHHQNIYRLFCGTEYRFGKTGTTAA